VKHGPSATRRQSRRSATAVYTSPSLWSIFVFEIYRPFKPIQKKFDCLISFAKNAPVDLFLTSIHDHEGYWSCPCPDRVSSSHFLPSLCQITNLRSLSLNFLNISGQAPVTPDTLPSLTDVTYFHIDGCGWGQETINPAEFFRLMLRLVELKLTCTIFKEHYGREMDDGVLLPRLRSLDLSAEDDVLYTGTASHCWPIAQMWNTSVSRDL
jgi:hypothetical protein